MLAINESIALLIVAVVSGVFGFVIAQDRRITRLEERTRQLGHELLKLPKRKGD